MVSFGGAFGGFAAWFGLLLGWFGFVCFVCVLSVLVVLVSGSLTVCVLGGADSFLVGGLGLDTCGWLWLLWIGCLCVCVYCLCFLIVWYD